MEIGGPQSHFIMATWRIIPVSKWLVTPVYKPRKGHLEGVPQPYLGDLLTMVINHLLNGMILQVVNLPPPNGPPPREIRV